MSLKEIARLIYGTGRVLDNDIDYDASGLIRLTGADLDTTATVGSIVWNSTLRPANGSH